MEGRTNREVQGVEAEEKEVLKKRRVIGIGGIRDPGECKKNEFDVRALISNGGGSRAKRRRLGGLPAIEIQGERTVGRTVLSGEGETIQKGWGKKESDGRESKLVLHSCCR